MSKDNKKSIYVDNKLWVEAEQKAKRPEIDRSISQIIRRLLEMWVNDEVMPYPEEFNMEGQ